ncbi:glycosyltransferase [Aureisphaera galaxeae]|uniref:glycosyltransferase family 32 protein n=1 Tax=Aureisphaera galaxeae TaxID=1538023 RepID=UPI002350E3D6|nr:glycosyltransferase [Aureisphaera galaxeae]MDC8006287.1 glycosyltransferase [Aureisphaera galaxeae]
MIPKKIHYCWFGKGKKPEVFQRCLESWKTHCPDFEIKEWNEDNFFNTKHAFYKNALRKKRYAFVSDYVRTVVLLKEGGVYMDTDMLLIKPINPLLSNRFVIGEEVKGRVNFAFFAAEPENRWVQQMKNYYDTHTFNPFSPPVITHTFTPMLVSKPLEEGELILDTDYFYALPYEYKEEPFTSFISENSYGVHLWDHSWKPKKKETTKQLVGNLVTVCNDYWFHGYPKWYFRRYAKEFSRKLYHKIVGKGK